MRQSEFMGNALQEESPQNSRKRPADEELESDKLKVGNV